MLDPPELRPSEDSQRPSGERRFSTAEIIVSFLYLAGCTVALCFIAGILLGIVYLGAATAVEVIR